MKKLLISIFLILFSLSGLHAQKLMIGEKAPEIKVEKWLGGSAPSLDGKVVLVDFFHSSNNRCILNLPELDGWQKRYDSRLSVVVIMREDFDKINPSLEGKGYGFHVGLDDAGKTFGGYGVRFVPFSALIDARGRLVWTGNVSSLSKDIIDKAFK